MAPCENSQQPSKKLASLCHTILFSKLWSAATYGMEANIYRPVSVNDMQLSSQQCLLLALLNSLVTRDVMSCSLLANICCQVEKLRSRNYKVWLLEDFVFPQSDVQKAMAFLAELIADNILKLPPHVMGIMTSLANKYGVTGIQLRTLSEEDLNDLAIQLENAVINNSPRDIIAIAAEGGDINRLTQSGDNLIHLAARANNCASIVALDFLKANLEAMNTKNATPLAEAVKNNHVSSIKALLKAGANVDKHLYRGDTYLHIAAAGGNNEALEALLETEMYVHNKNHFGETPLSQAISAGNIRGIEMLLKKEVNEYEFKRLTELVLESQNPDTFKAFVKSVIDFKSENVGELLHLVALSGNVERLKAIKNITFPGNIKIKNSPLHVTSDPSFIRMLIGMGIDVNIKNGANETALHVASAKGSIELAKVLVQHGAVVDSRNYLGFSAMMVACANSKENIAKFLLYNGANPNIKDRDGRTPLHYAAEVGCVGLVTTLLDAGAKVDDQDSNGKTPAFVAALNNKPSILKLLVENDANLIFKDRDGDSIIHRVAWIGHNEVMAELLDAGVEVDMKGQHQRTALHLAALQGHIAVVTALLDAGAAMDMKDWAESTALDYAVKFRYPEVVKVLLDRGADSGAKTDFGRTSLNVASSQG